MKRVRANKIYRFKPVGLDLWDSRATAEPGQPVKVIALPGCPKPNTMDSAKIVKTIIYWTKRRSNQNNNQRRTR